MSATSLETDSIDSSNEARQFATEIVEESLTEVFTQVSEKDCRFKCYAMNNKALEKALEDILNVYETLKPFNDHTHIIDAWKRDKSAKLTTPDILLKDFV